MIKEYLEIGKITSTHGIKGEMRVQPWCDTPEFMKKFKTLSYTILEPSINEIYEVVYESA